MTTSTSQTTPQSGAQEKLEQVQHGVGEVAGTAAGEAKNVAREAGDEIRELAGTLKAQVGQQSQAGLDRLVETMSSFAEELSAMAAGERPAEGMAADLVRQASTRSQDFADSLRGRAPGDLLHDVEGFARRRPGAFLLAAAVGGVLVGRMTRGAMAASSDSESHVDLRDGTPVKPVGMEGAWGLGGPGSLGAEGLEDGLGAEIGSVRTGAGQGLGLEQGGAMSGSAGTSTGSGTGRSQDEPVIISALNHPTSADDTPGGTAQMPNLDAAVEEGTFQRGSRPRTQP